MRHISTGLALIALLLFSCGAGKAAERDPPAAPIVRDGVVFPDSPPGAAPSLLTVSPLPSRPPLYPMAAPSVPLGQIGAAPNLGPVTGYGPGGMGHVPGSPPNPPYR